MSISYIFYMLFSVLFFYVTQEASFLFFLITELGWEQDSWHACIWHHLHLVFRWSEIRTLNLPTDTYQSGQPSEEAAVLEVLAADDVPDAREPVGHDHVEAQHEKEEGKTEKVKWIMRQLFQKS